MKLDYLSTAVTACCILHNICEVYHDEFYEQWLDDVNKSSQVVKAPYQLLHTILAKEIVVIYMAVVIILLNVTVTTN